MPIKEGLSDLNFWDKSRSSKTVGIISAQSVSSFYAAIGSWDVANTILQNFRQKLFSDRRSSDRGLFNPPDGTRRGRKAHRESTKLILA